MPNSLQDSLITYNALQSQSNNFGDNFHDSLSIINNGGKPVFLPVNINIISQSNNSSIAFVQNNMLYVAKLINKKATADSVRAKHILLKDKALAIQLIEGLKTGKLNWTEVNKKYSQDFASAQKDGDLGYFPQGMMVKDFNDLCFNEQITIGSYDLVETQFGNHIVQIIDRKYISATTFQSSFIAFSMPITLSEKTIKETETSLNEILKKNKNYEELEKTLVNLGKKFDEIPVYSKGFDKSTLISDAPQIIKVANETNKSVSFVIYGMEKIISQVQNLEDIKREYDFSIKKNKKAAIFEHDMSRYKSLKSLALKYNITKENACFMADGTCSNEKLDLLNGSTNLSKYLENYSVGQIVKGIEDFDGVYFIEVTKNIKH